MRHALPSTTLDPPGAPPADAAAQPAEIEARLASAGFLSLVPLEFARDRLVISQGEDEHGVEVIAAAGREGDDLVAHNLGVRLGRPVALRIAGAESIATAVERLAASQPAHQRRSTDSDGDEAVSAGLDDRDLAAILAADERDLLQTAGRAPVVRLVNGLLFEALSIGASDVHVQAAPPASPAHPTAGDGVSAGGLIVRYRVDGALFEARSLPRRLLEPVVSRVKVMARMDVAERRLPQDGRASVTIGRQEIDLRVSSLPTALGERVVIRLLDKRRVDMFDLDRLGMPEDVRGRFERVCERPYGMVLVTGPTGSGKTTTLYSALRRIATPDRNVLTIEDPIEYELSSAGATSGGAPGGGGGGVSQSQVNAKKGVTFATGLRHILRQDPDVIMVGEIRDAETARIAIQAALTGHLVFSTLHTNSAASAVTRLLDLGVEPYLINAAVAAVLAQRLVRTVCSSCGGSERAEAGGNVCASCRGTGLRGRIGLFELLVMDARLRDMLARGATASTLEQAARRAPTSMRTLRDAGLAAVAAGLTTRAEVDRVTLLDDALEDAPAPGTAPGTGPSPELEPEGIV